MLLLPFILGCEPIPAGTTLHEGDADTDSDADADSDADGDDADDTATAWPLELATDFEAAIDGDDVDFFRVSGTAGTQFRVQVVNSDEDEADDSLDTVVEVFDSAGNRVAWEDEHPAGEVGTYDTVCFGFFPSTGDYFVKVQDRRTFEGSTSPVDDTDYTIQVLVPGSLPDEPDSLLSVGNAFDLSNAYSWYSVPVLIEAPGDVDYVSFGLPYSGAAVVFASAQHIESSPAVPMVEVYNEAAERVFSAETTHVEDARQLLDNLGTTYVLAVSDAGGGGGEAYGAWVFVLVAEEGYGNPRETEPNDDPAYADVIEMVDQEPSAGRWFAGFAEGRVESEIDVDTYAVSVEDESYLSVAFGAQGYGGLLVADVAIYDGSGALVASATGTLGVDPELDNSGPWPAGDYTVYVRAAVEGDAVVGGVGEGGSYRLGVHATSVPL